MCLINSKFLTHKEYWNPSISHTHTFNFSYLIFRFYKSLFQSNRMYLCLYRKNLLPSTENLFIRPKKDFLCGGDGFRGLPRIDHPQVKYYPSPPPSLLKYLHDDPENVLSLFLANIPKLITL